MCLYRAGITPIAGCEPAEPSIVGEVIITAKSHRLRVGAILSVFQVEVTTIVGCESMEPSIVGEMMIMGKSHRLLVGAILSVFQADCKLKNLKKT